MLANAGRPAGMRSVSRSLCPFMPLIGAMKADNIIEFPLNRRRHMRSCPHCGSRSDVWQIGRLLWGYCDVHEVRWVAADTQRVTRATINRTELRKGLEFLATFVEVSA